MKHKTQVHADDHRHDILISRVFDLPLDLLFKAYTVPEFVEQWMGTKVIKLENRPHGGWRFETRDPEGKVVFSANGAVHEFSPGHRIVRTFQMENSPFEPQLEFLEFEALDEGSSKLSMHIVFRSVELRDQMLKLPFAYGLNMAHDRLQSALGNLQ